MSVVINPTVATIGRSVTARYFGTGDGSRVLFNLAGLDSDRAYLMPVLFKQDWGGIQQLYGTARTNLLLQSQTFNTSWTRINCTVPSPNDVVAPDGTQTADTVSVTANGVAAIYQQVTATTTTVTVSCYTKAGTRASTRWLVYNATTATGYQVGIFTYATGAITGAGWTATDIGGGWYRLSFTQSTGVTIGNGIQFYCGDDGSGSYLAGETWVLWGAMLGVTGVLTPYIPTTTAAVTVTDYSVDTTGKVTTSPALPLNTILSYRDPHAPSGNIYRAFGMGDGTSVDFSLPFVPKVPVLYQRDWQGNQLLYPTARTNSILQSQTVASATWLKVNCTVTPDTVIAPDGTLTADTITATANGTIDFFQTSIIANGTSLVCFTHTKAGTRPTASFMVRNNTTATNYDEGVLTFATGVITGTGWSVAALGNGWFKVKYTKSTGITIGDSLRFYTGGSSISAPWVAGETVVVWGADVKFDGVFSSYIPTTTAPVTVTDYTYTPNGAVTMAVAPVVGAILTADMNFGPQP